MNLITFLSNAQIEIISTFLSIFLLFHQIFLTGSFSNRYEEIIFLFIQRTTINKISLGTKSNSHSISMLITEQNSLKEMPISHHCFPISHWDQNHCASNFHHYHFTETIIAKETNNLQLPNILVLFQFFVSSSAFDTADLYFLLKILCLLSFWNIIHFYIFPCCTVGLLVFGEAS